MSNNRFVIVGNSAAAISAMEAIRAIDKESRLTLISKEDLPAYSRVLTPYIISGERDSILIRSREHYAHLRVSCRWGRSAVRIEDNTVLLDDGEGVPFDRLLIATGSHAARPAMEIPDIPGIFVLKDIEDAQAICRRAAHARNALIIGGGLICMLVARALLKKGLNLTLAVSSDRILSRMLDDEGADIVRSRLESEGVTVYTRTDVVGFESGPNGVTAVRSKRTTNPEKIIPADLVIIAKGVRSNTALAESAGLTVDRGIIIDRKMRTSRKDIFAAGDVAESYDLLIPGKRTICATWFEAVYQGRMAGENIAGKSVVSPGSMKMNVMSVADTPVATIGHIDFPGGTEELTSHLPENGYRKLFLHNGRIVGAILVGEIGDAGLITHMIRHRIQYSKRKHLDPSRVMQYTGLLR